jgi:hypothetical protein
MRPFPRTIEEYHGRKWRRGNAVVKQIVNQVPRVQCAWCCAAMSADLVPADKVSHGICERCFSATVAELGEAK